MEIVKSDITVVGGGLSGICAAISAARMGYAVALAGDRPVLGGNSSSEVRVWTRGATGGGSLFMEEMGILGEMKLRNLHVNPDGNVLFWDEVLLDFVLAEENVKLFLNTAITDVQMDKEKIQTVQGFQLGSERRLSFESDYYIDCSGDGTVLAHSGAEFTVGMESASTYGEEYAPKEASANTLGSSIIIYTKKAGHPIRYIPPNYAYSMEKVKSIIHKGGRLVNEKQTGSDYWWFEYGGELDTVADAQDISIELKKLVFGVWNYIKNSGLFPAEELTLEWVGSFAGKRESRRAVSDYVLTQRDIFENRSFKDNGFYGGWYLDFHPSDGIFSEDNSCTQIPVRAYPVPLRTLFSSKCPNLLFAGRIIGASHAAFASTRDMNTCALSGQAAGTLAAFCLKEKMMPESVVKENCLSVQKQLAKDDVLIMDIDCRDENDLAQRAQVTASSYYDKQEGKHFGDISLTAESFVCFPVRASESPQEAVLYISCKKMNIFAVDCYFSNSPSRLSPGTFIKKQEFSLESGENQALRMELPPLCSDGFIVALFPAVDGAAIQATEYAPVGFLMGHQWSMDHLYPRIDAKVYDFYHPAKVINGISRPYGAPNLWISGNEAKPYIQFQWEKKISVSAIRLYLNPDLSREHPSSFTERWNDHHYMASTLGQRSPLLAKEFYAYIQTDGAWQTVAHVEDNWQRMVTLKLSPPVATEGVRIAFPRKKSDPPAQVYEIRVY